MRTQPEGLPLKYRAVVGATRLISGFLSGYVLVGIKTAASQVAVISSPRNPNPIGFEETRRRAFVVKVQSSWCVTSVRNFPVSRLDRCFTGHTPD